MTQETLLVPMAKTVPTSVTHLGHVLNDNYAWLQDKNDPEVIAYLNAENAYSKIVLKHTENLQEELFQEMKGRIQEDDSNVPEQRGEYFYYWRIQAGKQYKLYCRKHRSLDNAEEILVDENQLAEGHSYCQLNAFEPSPDQHFLAYSVDTTGAWVFDLYVKDMQTGELVAGPISNVAWTVAWASDNRTLFYTIFDSAHRPHQLWRHTIGEASAPDRLVFHEPDDSFPIYINRTRSGAYLLLTLMSLTTTEVHYLEAERPREAFRVIHPRQHMMEYYVDHHGDQFLIRTNEDAENFKLMQTPISEPAKTNWRPVIPHRTDTLLEDIDSFRDFLVIYERQHGLRQIRISAPDALSNVHYVSFPEPVYTFRNRANPAFETNKLRFLYSSMVTPESTIDFDVDTHEWEVKKQQHIPSGYDQNLYESQRLYATTTDGVQVPVSLVYRKGLQKDGSHPLLLDAYGSYGFSNDANFDTKRLSLLDRGFVFAIAHVRGGSELGRAWYEDGRLMHKKNTFTDFIAAAECLIRERYTSAKHLSIIGASAGGLLMSAVANMRPDLFKAIVALVPFTNVITAILIPDLPLTVIEYEQWGHPNDPEAFAYMLSYSPYENVEKKDYPHLYVKAGLNDLQVPYWDPAKWVAKLRALKTDQNRLLLVTLMGAGHGGSSGRYDSLREYAEIYAFLIDTLGVQESGG